MYKGGAYVENSLERPSLKYVDSCVLRVCFIKPFRALYGPCCTSRSLMWTSAATGNIYSVTAKRAESCYSLTSKGTHLSMQALGLCTVFNNRNSIESMLCKFEDSPYQWTAMRRTMQGSPTTVLCPRQVQSVGERSLCL